MKIYQRQTSKSRSVGKMGTKHKKIKRENRKQNGKNNETNRK